MRHVVTAVFGISVARYVKRYVAPGSNSMNKKKIRLAAIGDLHCTKASQGKLLLPAFKAIAVMPISTALRTDLKVQALAEVHPSPIANHAVSAPPTVREQASRRIDRCASVRTWRAAPAA